VTREADSTVGWRLLLFGASGAIGDAVRTEAIERGWSVTAVSRAPRADTADTTWRSYDALRDDGSVFVGDRPFDAVCWAHGANMTDSVRGFDPARHLDLYRANCLSIICAMAMLVEHDLLRTLGARLVLVSSIWQERARADKMSYTVTKAAVGGLVRSASVDLGRDGHLVNGVLPGVLDTPMTRANLSAEQIETVTSKTPLGRLPDLATLASTICFLASLENTSISGQSITVDLGMSNAILL
jgi:3-oxoacyl-[acyl-carrier protein] reductase